jgi:lysophospholipase L1-like esterase
MNVKKFAEWVQGIQSAVSILDGGGKRSATPFSHGRDVSAAQLIFLRPKALSSLRSASALQDALRLAMLAVGILAASTTTTLAQTGFKFDFSAKAKSGWTHVAPTNLYSSETGFGFEPGATITVENSKIPSVTSTNPFCFSVKLPEGNYRVTVTLDEGSVTTIKAEQRRLMMEHVQTAKDKTAQRSFIVNVHTPRISDAEKVKLKKRELETETVNWDEKLTLEFNDANPCLSKLEIIKADVPTIFIAGDSTVCDQPAEPWNSWGQMLPRFFKPEIAVANYAESGESIKSSLGAKRFDKVFSLMKSGDYLFVQFGHNDMKDKATNALETYKANLKKLVARTRELGGTPVLVTSMERKGGVERDTLAGYPQTVRDVAKEENCAMIDLHAMSRTFYRALRENVDKAFQDGTHHNNYGSYELAKCVVNGIRENKLPLAKSIADDFGNFDPAKPDDVNAFEMPISPNASKEKPLGN